MIGQDPPDDRWLDDVLRWLHGLADRLAQAAADTRRVTGQIERCWVDDHGRDRVERAGLVQRQLDRDAVACAELARHVARTVREQPALLGPVDVSDTGSPPPVPGGPLLGSTAVRRVDAARGMRIATLSDAESMPGNDH